MKAIAISGILACVFVAVARAEPAPEEVVITAGLRPETLARHAGSATVLSQATLESAGEQHLADVLSLVPDLGAAGGTSRPRYFQLRGVGEREQYQGAPNPSVGFLFDDIDLSGIGMPATLFDLDSVEVLRGPQGTAYGANALAGLISVRSVAPRTASDWRAEAMAGDYGTWSAGLAGGSGFGGGDSAWRMAAQQYRSDGFRDNRYLGRKDTNGFDERSLRLRLHWAPAGRLQNDISLIDVRLANGYDAWSLDNSRTTLSDRPGTDAQHTRGISWRLQGTLADGRQLQAIASAADTRSHYSYDGDWANDIWWGANGPYDFSEAIARQRRNAALDLRLLGGENWLVGVYALRLREAQQQVDTGLYGQGPDAFGPYQTSFGSRYSALNSAAYAQRRLWSSAQAALELGLRIEQRRSDYSDNLSSATLRAVDRMAGGSLAWRWRVRSGVDAYALLARGYKAGGYNIGAAVDPAERQFAPEALWNLETGLRLRHAGERPASLSAAVFAMRRQHQQVQVSSQSDPANPLLFVYLTQNAGGRSLGAELEGNWQAAPRLDLGATLALLDARYSGYCFQGSVIAGSCSGVNLDGAREAWSPPYQLSLQATWRSASGWFLRGDWQAVAARYFGSERAEHAPGYQLATLHAGFARRALNVELWVRNLFNARYAVHGFHFGNEPPDFLPKLYLQQGDPRHAGLSVRYAWH